MPTANEQLLARTTSHQVGLLRLGGSVALDAVGTLNSADEELTRLVESEVIRILGAPLTAQRDMIARLFQRLRGLSGEVYAVVERRVLDRLMEVAAFEARFQARLIAQVGGPSIDPGAIARELLAQRPVLGRTLAEAIADSRDHRARALERLVRESARTEERAKAIQRRLARELERGRQNADAVARTWTQATADDARRSTATAADLKLELWVSVLDSGTTPTCRANDHSTRAIGKQRWSNGYTGDYPAHWGERSVIVSLMESVVPDKLTYPEWLARQDVGTQREVLGDERFRLYRDGRLTDLARYVDSKGRPYTLEQLERREEAAFARMRKAA